MKTIRLEGEIGWDFYPWMMDQELSLANGDDVEVIFMTPGGSISKGLAINTSLSNYKKDNKNAQMIAHVVEANSMGSHILANSAFDLRTAEETSIAMIHNPIKGFIGDYKIMQKAADFLERLAGVMSIAYSKLMGKSDTATKKIMDDETWFLGGAELKAAGLVDEIVSSDVKSTTVEAHTKSELRFKAVMVKVINEEITEADIDKDTAMISGMIEKKPDPKMNNNPAPGGENNQEEISMETVEDLKKEKPEIYAKMVKDNFEAGVTQANAAEKERVKTLIEMKSRKEYEGITAMSDRIDEGIVNGEDKVTVQLGLMAILSGDGNVQAAMDTKLMGNINQPKPRTVSGEAEIIYEDPGF